MIEFMLGLVAIMILLMGLNQVASIVFNDFETIISAREQVADDLMDGAAGTDSVGSDIYDIDAIEGELQESMNPDGDLEDELENYPSGRENQFSFLWEGDNPLQEMTSSEKSSSIDVTAPLLRKILGRSTVQINNAVYMPPWEDLLAE